MIAAAGGALMIHRFAGSQDRLALVGALATGTVGFCYFVQQQKLAEIRLFKELFTEFNRRYDTLNGDLYDIRTGIRAIDEAARKTLIDYFNLCSEEFLFYQEGYIHPIVWRSWCRGTLWYLTAPIYARFGIRKSRRTTTVIMASRSTNFARARNRRVEIEQTPVAA